MRNHSKRTNSKSSFYRLIAATLTMGGVSLLFPLLASAQNATAAGTPIINRATGTYEDPSQPGITIDTTSNTVTVTVAEVAGITVTDGGTTDSTPLTPILGTDTITYAFLITNVGNDTTSILIPAPVITGPATLTGTITYDIDANGDGTFELLGQTLIAAQAAILRPGGGIRVNVPVLVDATATSGAPIVVRLGDTPPNDNGATTQNQLSTNLATDLRTVDAANGTAGETTGIPTNGEREASRFIRVLVGATPQAFAAILKTQGISSNNATPADFSDDEQTYNLELRVDNAAPAGASPSLTPADLAGTPITVTGLGTVNRILVSDAIPANTVLIAAPIAPAGWTVVYTTSPTATLANAATWTTTAPGVFPAPAITRVGFINDGPIARGTTVTGFSFQVRTIGLPAAAGGSIYNIAQLFGQSVGGTTVVYDESGDRTPSNFNDDGTGGPGLTTGVANPSIDGLDNVGNNTGTGTGGENNVLTLAPAGTLLNGPLGNPAAVGPTNNNDDFTDRSTTIPVNTAPGTLIDPPSLTFTNTLNAPSTTALTNVLLRPVAPATATDLPVNTTVTLTYAGQSAVYTYNGTQFIFSGGTAIQIPTIPGNSSVNYTVAIDLPTSALSTDLGRGYPVPILAFSDVSGDGILQASESNNTTINRVYTGFLRLIKNSQVLVGTGPAVLGTDGTLDSNLKTPSPGNILRYVISYSNIATPPVGAGNAILNATNVAIFDSGVLNTAIFPVLPNGNNWGQDYNPNIPSVIDTSHVVGSAIDSGTGSVITFFAGAAGTTSVTEQTGTTQATDITRYVNTLSVPVAPGSPPRTFEFQRRLN